MIRFVLGIFAFILIVIGIFLMVLNLQGFSNLDCAGKNISVILSDDFTHKNLVVRLRAVTFPETATATIRLSETDSNIDALGDVVGCEDGWVTFEAKKKGEQWGLYKLNIACSYCRDTYLIERINWENWYKRR